MEVCLIFSLVLLWAGHLAAKGAQNATLYIDKEGQGLEFSTILPGSTAREPSGAFLFRRTIQCIAGSQEIEKRNRLASLQHPSST